MSFDHYFEPKIGLKTYHTGVHMPSSRLKCYMQIPTTLGYPLVKYQGYAYVRLSVRVVQYVL